MLAITAWLGLASSFLLGPALVLVIAAPFWLIRAFVRYLNFANLRFTDALAIDAVTAVIQLSLMAYLMLTDQLSAAATYVTMGVACAVTCTAWWFARRVPVQFALHRVWPDFRANWTFSRWALASQLVGCVTPYLLPWILVRARGEADTGTFAACTNLCGIATMFVLGLAHALTPQAARAFAAGGTEALNRLLARTTVLFVSGVGIFCIVVIAAGDFAMTLIYGPSFTGTHVAVSLLALGVLANSCAIITGNGLWAVNRPEANLVADTTVLLITLGAAALLIEPYGVTGAALCVLLGSSAGALTRFFVFRRVLREVAIPAVTG
jgi:O-antigen/teichoic acid export membrane protein